MRKLFEDPVCVFVYEIQDFYKKAFSIYSTHHTE